MRTVKRFKEYLENGLAKKTSPDHQRAANLREEAARKHKKLLKEIKIMGFGEDDANDYIEDCYDIIMPLIRAKMHEEGYNTTGKGAHEAEVAYARELGLTENELETLDQLRYFRNGICYYGKRFDKEYAEKTIQFMERIAEKLRKSH